MCFTRLLVYGNTEALLAHESVAAAVVWTLFSLCNDPAIQTRLRTELQGLSNDNPSADELNSLVYLEYVIRESLRYHCIPAAYERVAVADDVIPCEAPYQDRHGNTRSEIMSVSISITYELVLTLAQNCQRRCRSCPYSHSKSLGKYLGT